VSKLAGELYAQAYLDHPLIIRTSGVFRSGRIENGARQFHRADAAAGGQSGKPIRVVDDHVASPTYSPLLAARSADLVDRGSDRRVPRRRRPSHFVVRLCLHDFSNRRSASRVKPTSEREFRTAARRPKYSALSNAKMERSGIEPFPPLETAVRLYMEARALRRDDEFRRMNGCEESY
jgi:dTDP-4-dehydrorhamnose reductase